MLPHAPQPVLTAPARTRRHGDPVALLAAGLLVLASACADSTLAPDTSGEAPETAGSALSLERLPIGAERTGIITNGIITNGIITNGIITNGLALNSPLSNGLAVHGLAAQGLQSPAFATWFTAYPEADADSAMHYVVACAVPEGEQRTWTNPVSGTLHTWEGVLGLAPDWAQGTPASEAEQQLVSACLASLVNKYGVHVPISVRGRDGRGQELTLSPEDAGFTVREAAFFGNLFTGEGVYVCSDRSVLAPDESSVRACGISSRGPGPSAECQPLVHTGVCPQACRLESGHGFYSSCFVNGRRYMPLTTRLRQDEVYRCGDGVCQLTESCDSSRAGVGRTADNCLADCGRCN